MICIGLAFCLFASALRAEGDEGATIDESILDGIKLRNIGPANMGGRIVVHPENPVIVYVAIDHESRDTLYAQPIKGAVVDGILMVEVKDPDCIKRRTAVKTGSI